MNISKFIEELKRRNVVKVAIAYAIAGWLVIQVFDTIAPQLGFPEWIAPLITILVLIGFPITLIIAWAFELTPEGLKTTKEVDEDESIAHNTGSKINKLIIGGLCLLVIFLVVERVFFATSNLIDEPSVITNISDKSIAVLPFDDFNAGGQQEYFADGLTEEILNSLAKTPDLLVASRTSSFQYKDKNVDIIKIADSLGVAHILEGSIRESSDKYRITAQLIRASDGFHLWSETYDRPKTDIIDIQEDIAFQIATALETAMDPEALRKMVEVGTTNIEAYKQYIEGITLLNGSNFLETKKTYTLLEEARKLDPKFAQAHFQAANLILRDMSLTTMGSQALDFSYDEKLRMIDERLSSAIQYSNETDRLRYLATQAFVNMELRKSVDYLMQYIALRPSGIFNYNDIIYSLTGLGEYELAQQYQKQAFEYLLDNEFDGGLGISFYFWTNNWENADPWMQERLDKFPYDELLAYQAHRIMLWRGEYDRAREIKKRLKGIEIPKENFVVTDIRQACADGNTELANQLYESSNKGKEIASDWIALMTLGREDEAHNLIKYLDENKQLINLSGWLYYPYFDYTKYPNLNAMIETENHTRRPVVKIPFRCGR